LPNLLLVMPEPPIPERTNKNVELPSNPLVFPSFTSLMSKTKKPSSVTLSILLIHPVMLISHQKSLPPLESLMVHLSLLITSKVSLSRLKLCSDKHLLKKLDQFLLSTRSIELSWNFRLTVKPCIRTSSELLRTSMLSLPLMKTKIPRNPSKLTHNSEHAPWDQPFSVGRSLLPNLLRHTLRNSVSREKR